MENDLFSLFNYPQQVRHFLNRAAHRRRVGPLNDLIKFPQTQTRNDAFLRFGKGDPAAVILNPNLSRRGGLLSFFLGSHMLLSLYRSSTCLPRRRATSNGSFILSSPSKVARTTLCGLVEPRTFVRTSRTPAARITARTAPPAITPVPCDAGFIRTRPAPNLPIN